LRLVEAEVVLQDIRRLAVVVRPHLVEHLLAVVHQPRTLISQPERRVVLLPV